MSLSLRQNWLEGQQRLLASGLESARLDARFLLESVAGCTYTELITQGDRPLGPEQQQAFNHLIERRMAGEPLAYLLGTADFRGRLFHVTPDVLIPRNDTEILVEQALRQLSGRESAQVLDLGTGSGIIAITLALECPQAQLTAVDLSEQALSVARENGRRHHVEICWQQGSWYTPLANARFDLIVSNPPYIATDDPHLQGDGLPFEPSMALTDGTPGGRGLSCIEHIIRNAVSHLTPKGWLLFEHGHDQGEASRNLLIEHGFKDTFTQTDLAGLDRVSGGHI